MWFSKKKPILTHEDLIEMYNTIPDSEDKSRYIWIVPKHLENQFKAAINKRFTCCLWREKFMGCSIQPASYGDELNLISREQQMETYGYGWTTCR